MEEAWLFIFYFILLISLCFNVLCFNSVVVFAWSHVFVLFMCYVFISFYFTLGLVSRSLVPINTYLYKKYRCQPSSLYYIYSIVFMIYMSTGCPSRTPVYLEQSCPSCQTYVITLYRGRSNLCFPMLIRTWLCMQTYVCPDVKTYAPRLYRGRPN